MFMTFINNVISFFTGGKASLMFILVIATLSAVSYGLYERSNSLQTKLDYELAQKASIEANLKSSQESIVMLNERIKTSKIASQEFSEANKVINDKYIELEAKYKSFLGREQVVQKKPTLVNKRMNTAFNIFIDRVSCNSGVKTSCTEN